MATLESVATLVHGVIIGDPHIVVNRVAPLSTAGPGDLSFLAHARYRKQLITTKASAVLIGQDEADAQHSIQAPILVVCAEPYLAMAQAATYLHQSKAHTSGIAPAAHVADSARLGEHVGVGPGACIGAAAKIGHRTSIAATCVVGEHVTIGNDCVLHPGAKVLDGCTIADRVILHAGAVVGSDGFGYARDPNGSRVKVPQLGIVVIENDVEIGANATIDRATFGETRIGRGTKIDNLVQIAHNVALGEDCVVVSQSGIAGSTVLGNRVVMGAQSGATGHIHIGDDVALGGRGGATKSIKSPGTYSGMPALPHRQWLRSMAAMRDVQRLKKRVKDIASRLHDRTGEP